MPRRHALLALVVAACWAMNFVVIDVGLESFPPLLFAALRFGLTALPARRVHAAPGCSLARTPPAPGPSTAPVKTPALDHAGAC